MDVRQSSISGNIEVNERVKHLETIATHFLGDVSLSLPSLRAMTQKIEATSSKGYEGPIHMGSDVEDMALKDERFVVKTLSRNTARKKVLPDGVTLKADSPLDYSGEFSHWNFSQKIRKRVDEYLEVSFWQNRNMVPY